MIEINRLTKDDFIILINKYSLGYGFKIYYKEVKRGKHVAQNFVYFANLKTCYDRINHELELLNMLDTPTLESWYNSYKMI